MCAILKIYLNEKLFLKDPEETELGRKIIQKSIDMIDKIGFEQFTFKKLALAIQSTESSIYRYFENKHRLLIYIISWYWAWLNYRIDFQTNNISDHQKKLKIIIKEVAESSKPDASFIHINENTLHRIVVAEAVKVYLTKDVDSDNKDGFFKEYTLLCRKIAELISKINPNYKYAHSLAGTIIETAHQQLFFAWHFKTITEMNNNNLVYKNIAEFIEHIAFSAINSNNS
ncbi:MAG: TetR/AcrR family transcriptional regulator [Cytophagaceae bacterium]